MNNELEQARLAITRRLDAESQFLQDHIRVWAHDPHTPKELRDSMQRILLVVADTPGVETGMVYCETHGFQYHWHHQCAVCRHAARGETE